MTCTRPLCARAQSERSLPLPALWRTRPAMSPQGTHMPPFPLSPLLAAFLIKITLGGTSCPRKPCPRGTFSEVGLRNAGWERLRSPFAAERLWDGRRAGFFSPQVPATWLCHFHSDNTTKCQTCVQLGPGGPRRSRPLLGRQPRPAAQAGGPPCAGGRGPGTAG